MFFSRNKKPNIRVIFGRSDDNVSITNPEYFDLTSDLPRPMVGETIALLNTAGIEIFGRVISINTSYAYNRIDLLTAEIVR